MKTVHALKIWAYVNSLYQDISKTGKMQAMASTDICSYVWALLFGSLL